MTNKNLQSAAGLAGQQKNDDKDFVLQMSAIERLQELQPGAPHMFARLQIAGALEHMLGMPGNPCPWTCYGCGNYYRVEVASGAIEFYKREGFPICSNCYRSNKSLAELNLDANLLDFRFDVDNKKCGLCTCHPDERNDSEFYRVTSDGVPVALCRNCYRCWANGLEFWELELNIQRSRGRNKRKINDDDFICPVCGSDSKPVGYSYWEVRQRVCKKCHTTLHRSVFDKMPNVSHDVCVAWLKANKAVINCCNMCGTGQSCKPRCRVFGEKTLCLLHACEELQNY